IGESLVKVHFLKQVSLAASMVLVCSLLASGRVHAQASEGIADHKAHATPVHENHPLDPEAQTRQLSDPHIRSSASQPQYSKEWIERFVKSAVNDGIWIGEFVRLANKTADVYLRLFPQHQLPSQDSIYRDVAAKNMFPPVKRLALWSNAKHLSIVLDDASGYYDYTHSASGKTLDQYNQTLQVRFTIMLSSM